MQTTFCLQPYTIIVIVISARFALITALLKVKIDILLNMNKQQVTLLVLLDLSAAFDTVDHNILIRALTKLGLGEGGVLQWFASYLSGRCQRISVRGCQSEKSNLHELWNSSGFLSWSADIYNLL